MGPVHFPCAARHEEDTASEQCRHCRSQSYVPARPGKRVAKLNVSRPYALFPRAWRCSTCLCIRHRRGESVLQERQRRPSQGRRAAVASMLVAVGHVRAAAGAARGPQCPEIPHVRQARRTGDRTNRPRKADHGIGVNRAFKSGSWEAAPHFRKNHQGPPASYPPEALDPQPDCACQYRPYASAVPATAEQVMA